jgi:hypothetical protein
MNSGSSKENPPLQARCLELILENQASVIGALAVLLGETANHLSGIRALKFLLQQVERTEKMMEMLRGQT